MLTLKVSFSTKSVVSDSSRNLHKGKFLSQFINAISLFHITFSSVVVENKNCSRITMQLVFKKYKKFFGDEHDFYYDLQSLLFTTHKLPENWKDPVMIEDIGIVCRLFPEDYKHVPELERFTAQISVAFKPVQRDQEIIAGDNSQGTNKDSGAVDRLPCNFLEIGIAQELYFNQKDFIAFQNGRFYLVKPQDFINPELVQRCNNLSQNKYIAPGFKKGIRFVDGPQKDSSFGLFLYRKYVF